MPPAEIQEVLVRNGINIDFPKYNKHARKLVKNLAKPLNQA